MTQFAGIAEPFTCRQPLKSFPLNKETQPLPLPGEDPALLHEDEKMISNKEEKRIKKFEGFIEEKFSLLKSRLKFSKHDK